ncbi:MAG: hypothetical protein JW999_10315 [Methanotrichaceae archaeon]|nr:hypothetical protein [Methanotrichaceae archaeon]
MMIRNFILLAILLLTFSVSISLVPAQDLSSDDVNRMTEDRSAMENNATTKEDAPTTSASMQGIWKASLGEEEIIMAVNQSEESLFGRAKFEGENPWNGALAGSISQNAVSFSMAAMEGEALASIYISANLEEDTMRGFFIRSDSSGKASRGDFTATMISPDTSIYTPALVTIAPLPAVQTEQVTIEQKNDVPAIEENEKTALVPKRESRFQDVTDLAKGINPNIMPPMAPL